jgi:hypothetical protein
MCSVLDQHDDAPVLWRLALVDASFLMQSFGESRQLL